MKYFTNKYINLLIEILYILYILTLIKGFLIYDHLFIDNADNFE